jgi:peptidoglycan/xylan/chitin deacetylase (PgdA/CDA1 family)
MHSAASRSRWRPTPLLLASAGWHTACAIALGVSPARWAAVVGSLVANHLLLTAAGLWPQSRLLGPNRDRLPAEAARRGEVALTFDDGPDPEVTPRVLDLLATHGAGAKATFFCIGRRAAAHADLVGEIVRQGHRVENHSFSHPAAFSLYPPAALAREVRLGQETLARTAGRVPELFRAPAGLRSFLLEPVLRAHGLSLVSWTRRGFDTVVSDPVRVARRLLDRLGPGDVLLLHDGSASRDRLGRPVVLEALPRVLDALAARGLRPVTMNGLAPWAEQAASTPRPQENA